MPCIPLTVKLTARLPKLNEVQLRRCRIRKFQLCVAPKCARRNESRCCTTGKGRLVGRLVKELHGTITSLNHEPNKLSFLGGIMNDIYPVLLWIYHDFARQQGVLYTTRMLHYTEAALNGAIMFFRLFCFTTLAAVVTCNKRFKENFRERPINWSERNTMLRLPTSKE